MHNCFNQANIGTVSVYFNQEREKEEKQCKKVAADISLKKNKIGPLSVLIKPALELFQRQYWGNSEGEGREQRLSHGCNYCRELT